MFMFVHTYIYEHIPAYMHTRANIFVHLFTIHTYMLAYIHTFMHAVYGFDHIEERERAKREGIDLKAPKSPNHTPP